MFRRWIHSGLLCKHFINYIYIFNHLFPQFDWSSYYLQTAENIGHSQKKQQEKALNFTVFCTLVRILLQWGYY